MVQSVQYYWEMGFLISKLEKMCPIHVEMFDLRVRESWFELRRAQYIEHRVLVKVLRLVLTVWFGCWGVTFNKCVFAYGAPRPHQDGLKRLKYQLSLVSGSILLTNGIDFKNNRQEI